MGRNVRAWWITFHVCSDISSWAVWHFGKCTEDFYARKHFPSPCGIEHLFLSACNSIFFFSLVCFLMYLPSYCHELSNICRRLLIFGSLFSRISFQINTTLLLYIWGMERSLHNRNGLQYFMWYLRSFHFSFHFQRMIVTFFSCCVCVSSAFILIIIFIITILCICKRNDDNS